MKGKVFRNRCIKYSESLKYLVVESFFGYVTLNRES